jgi:2'-5' RNA ligase
VAPVMKLNHVARELMYEAFLQTPQTIAHVERDFVEWHGGIAHYGFWAVVVADPDWLAVFAAARAHVARFVHPGYRRAPHVTVAACGLLAESHVSAAQTARQTAVLATAKLAPFPLYAGPLDSFTSAPMITIQDPTGELERVRECITAVSPEDTPAPYQPHITLGLYRDAFDTAQVVDCLSAFAPAPVQPLLVTELAFCAFETKDIQGPIQILERVNLR